MRPGEPVEVGRWTWRWQAEMALEALREQDIVGVVVADDIGGQYVGIAPARLLVGSENADDFDADIGVVAVATCQPVHRRRLQRPLVRCSQAEFFSCCGLYIPQLSCLCK